MSTEGIDSNHHNGDPIVLTDRNDLYRYYKPATALAQLAMSCATPFVIGIYGRWGRGKSTFLQTVREKIRATPDGNTSLHFDYSPWQYQLPTFNDVWLSIISELSTKSTSKKVESALKSIVKGVTLRKAARGLLTAGASFVPVVGDNLKGAIEDAFGNDESPRNDYTDFIDAKAQFEKGIAEYLAGNAQARVYVYIDDIDRCEPQTSVNVLRAVQVLCRTKGCVFLLGIDRDVVVNNLRTVYNDLGYAKEYLDKVVQLHVELPVLETVDLEKALGFRSDGSPRPGLKPFIDWVTRFMDYNPRKVERFAYLYDYKLSNRKIEPNDFQAYRQMVLFTLWELRWPELATEIARSRDILQAIEELREASEGESKTILAKYRYIPAVVKIFKDAEFMHVFNSIYDVKA